MSNESRFYDIVVQSGLRPDVVGDLLDKGWVFFTAEGEPSLWVSPSALKATHVAPIEGVNYG